jgi:hypothetical protein
MIGSRYDQQPAFQAGRFFSWYASFFCPLNFLFYFHGHILRGVIDLPTFMLDCLNIFLLLLKMIDHQGFLCSLQPMAVPKV